MKTHIAKALCDRGLCPSMSMARRLVYQGVVKVDGQLINDLSTEVDIKPGTNLQIGKKEIIVQKDE